MSQEDANKKVHVNPLSPAEIQQVLDAMKTLSSLDFEVSPSGSQTFVAEGIADQGKVVRLVSAHVPRQCQAGPALVSFVLDLSKYVLKGKVLQNEKGEWFLDVSGPMYLAQRRENFRVDVPNTVVKQVVATPVNRPEKQLSAQMLNISLGGCLLEVENCGSTLNRGDELKLTVELENGKEISLVAEIKRVGKIPKRPDNRQVGLEYQQMNGFTKSRVNEVVMKCYRLTARYGRRLQD
jgi:hypothetical protein